MAEKNTPGRKVRKKQINLRLSDPTISLIKKIQDATGLNATRVIETAVFLQASEIASGNFKRAL